MLGFLRRHVGTPLLAMLLALVITLRPAIAEAQGSDWAGTAGSALMMGGMAMAMLSTDLGGSVTDCACVSSCNPVPWQKCAMAAMIVAGIGLSIASMFMSSGSGNAVKSGGGAGGGAIGSNSANGTPPPWNQSCNDNPSSCGFDQAGAADNPGCNPAALPKIIGKVDDTLKLAEKGLIDPGPNTSLDAFINDLKKNKADLEKLNDAIASGDTSGVDGLFGGQGGGNAAIAGAADRASAGSGGYDTSTDAGGAGVASTDASKTKAGPNDRTGLGLIDLRNGLSVTDAKTGNELTLWQRATRRYQGITNLDTEGKRGFFMARMEQLRSRALNVARARQTAAELPVVAKAEAKSAVKTEAKDSRAPASVAPAEPLNGGAINSPAKH